jgi:DNA adenine methylase
MDKVNSDLINCGNNNASPDEIKNAPGVIDPVKDQAARTPQADPGLSAVSQAGMAPADNIKALLNQPSFTQESVDANTDLLKFAFNGWNVDISISKNHAALIDPKADLKTVVNEVINWKRKTIIPRSPIRYCGGKNRYAKTIVDEFAPFGSDIKTFIEPFVGGGNVALEIANRYPQIDRIIVNDMDPAVANFWRCVADDHLRNQLVTMLRKTKESRQLEKQCMAELDSSDKLISAYSCFCVNHLHVGGKLKGTCPRDLTQNFNMPNLTAKIERIGSRLAGRLVVLNEDFETVLREFGNQPHTMAYLDPPYVLKSDELYRCKFTPADHERLAKVLSEISAPWVLSYDDEQSIKDRYANMAEIKKLKVNYCLNPQKVTHKTHELLFVRKVA